MKAIEVAEISKSFGKIKALDKVSLTVEEGELFGLIGPDAAGKSTLFNIFISDILLSLKSNSFNSLKFTFSNIFISDILL